MTMTNSERNTAIEAFLKAAEMQLEAEGEGVVEFAQRLLEQQQEAKRLRERSPNEIGWDDAGEGLSCSPARHGLETDADVEAYGDGYNDRRQDAEDRRVDQIECDFLDGECTISGRYYEHADHFG